MKKIILPLVFLLFAIQSFSQQTVRHLHSRDYYADKSTKLKTAAWVLAGTGAVAFTAGVLIFNNNQNSVDFENALNAAWAGVGLIVVGGAAIITSIPLFIVSGVMAKRAARLSIKNQRIFLPGQKYLAFKTQPALTLTIPL